MSRQRPRVLARAPGQPQALPASLHPVLRRVYAARGLAPEQLALDAARLQAPTALKQIDTASALLADAIVAQTPIVISGDYDADGATGVAVAVCGLRALGAGAVHYVVPDRFRMGYGLSPALAELAARSGAQLLITVDAGISSLEGVAHAQRLGLKVIVTDHHLPGSVLPSAEAIVNPNQPGCGFASKHLAGVGVMFYLLLATRAQLRAQNWFATRSEPNLAELLDLVAIGTVADVVRLDHNNRILVAQGLARIRAGRARPGVQALLQVAGRSAERLSATDLGFVLGPRINAAGRLEDIRSGIDCLLAADLQSALPMAQELERYNRERRAIETDMRETAELMIEDSDAAGICLFDESWHEGVVGLVASRIKERLHRPTFAFARAQEAGVLKGSGRSIAGLHLRDALAAIDAQAPGLILRYGGHAMAAGLSLAEARYEQFAQSFAALCAQWLDEDALQLQVHTDGELRGEEFSLDTARALEQGGPWGQGFPEPLFEGRFEVQSLRVLKELHVKYRLRSADGQSIEAMHFNGIEQLRERGSLHATYRLAINRWQGSESLELQLLDVLD
ncbi:single-stranded-DNA-specific exonuclease [Solimonas aquatica]|uniref:Single-stranded-DNA-specific exonuclease RecJ n=1 Tax=Solimonas aquatica TaxID=489703 RepID=A0A1H9AGW2_9GAMM|nr:single-stranded-DNA-specific exonuclease RecJ [Solimonas aquatica]SEP75899.1 single-stranded-DNA-specific exonuclease [Solimonas aquatica]